MIRILNAEALNYCDEARAMGLVTAVFGITIVGVPIVGTAVYDLWGHRTLWAAAAGITVVAALGYFWLASRVGATGSKAVERAPSNR